jgi:hypothetical protein
VTWPGRIAAGSLAEPGRREAKGTHPLNRFAIAHERALRPDAIRLTTMMLNHCHWNGCGILRTIGPAPVAHLRPQRRAVAGLHALPKPDTRAGCTDLIVTMPGFALEHPEVTERFLFPSRVQVGHDAYEGVGASKMLTHGEDDQGDQVSTYIQ